MKFFKFEDWNYLFVNYFQDPATPVSESLIDLYCNIIFYFMLLAVFVFWILLRFIIMFNWSEEYIFNYIYDLYDLELRKLKNQWKSNKFNNFVYFFNFFDKKFSMIYLYIWKLFINMYFYFFLELLNFFILFFFLLYNYMFFFKSSNLKMKTSVMNMQKFNKYQFLFNKPLNIFYKNTWLFTNFFWNMSVNKYNFNFFINFTQKNTLMVSPFKFIFLYFIFQLKNLYFSKYKFFIEYYLLKNIYLIDEMNYFWKEMMKDYSYKYNLNFLSTEKITHNTSLEIIWTLIPTVILIMMAMPSILFLYYSETLADSPVITMKIIGHQWYWTYEYNEFSYIFNLIDNDNSNSYTINKVLRFDSYMISEDDLNFGQLSMLETTMSMVIPMDTHIRLLMTADDVLHCWAVPSLGVKLDAVPGSLNQASIFVKRFGVFYGMCSEICGVNHGFMPMTVQAVSASVFISWFSNMVYFFEDDLI